MSWSQTPNLRAVVAIAVLALWVAGAVFAALTDDGTLLKVVTPMMTMVVGWLFTERASAPNGGVT